MKIVILLMACLCLSSQALDLTPLESIAVQEGGRKKPLLTYAQENVQKLVGRATWKKSETEKLSSMEVLFSMLLNQEEDWDNVRIIRFTYVPLKQKLSLPEKQVF